ncbi:MAG TPA: ABC transporter ATP-binding protein [Saprospiraceae bacterium]|nr:ABC transporter ATP-binding protein [Saprospiraceae bacterium]
MISLQNVKFSYSGSRPIFDDLQLELLPGNIYGLLGKNGAGKSTLLKLINGLVFAKQGTANVLGADPSERKVEMLSEIFFVQEEPFIPNMSILSYCYTYAPFYPRFDYDKFFKLISSFGLEGGNQMDKLSHGQKKKVVLSFAVSTQSKILILDEPTNGLDIPSKAEFRRMMTEAMFEDRMIIISTHQVRDMIHLIDPIIIVEDGKIIFQYSLEEIAKALYFETHFSMHEPEGVIYSERIAGGFLSIKENTGDQTSDPDIEVLFNAVLTKREQITAIMKKTIPQNFKQ